MIRYRFFTRHGGVSDPPFSSLNLSYGLGDPIANVAANRGRIKQMLGCRRLVSANQVHGSRIHVDDGAVSGDLEVDGCDALITATPGTGLLVQQADCQAVLLHDPARKVIGAIHNGWRGSVANVIAATVAAMTAHFRTDPADLAAWVSPSLGPCCAEFINYRRELPESFTRFMVGSAHFDFWRLSAGQLVEAGLAPGAISLPEVCTSCSEDYFSYRRARRQGDGRTGRHGSVIALVA